MTDWAWALAAASMKTASSTENVARKFRLRTVNEEDSKQGVNADLDTGENLTEIKCKFDQVGPDLCTHTWRAHDDRTCAVGQGKLLLISAEL